MSTDLQMATIGLLALLCVVVGWVAVEVWKVNRAIGPLASSPTARFVEGLGR